MRTGGRSTSHAESTYPQGVARTYLEREMITPHAENTSTRCGEGIPSKGDDKVTRGEYKSAGCGGDIPGKGEDNTARGASGPVGQKVVGCAHTCIQEASDGVPRVNVCSSRRFGASRKDYRWASILFKVTYCPGCWRTSKCSLAVWRAPKDAKPLTYRPRWALPW
jgi:hypothetical protein